MIEEGPNKWNLDFAHEHYRFLFEHAFDTMLILDETGTILDANRAGCERLGYTKEELLGKPVMEIDTVKYRSIVQERIQHVMEDGYGFFESEHVKKDGSIIPVEVFARVVPFHGKRLLLGIIRDISDRKSFEKELLHREQKYRATIESSADGFWIANVNGELLEVNDAYLQQSGYTREELYRLRIKDIDLNESEDEISRHLKRIQKAGHDRFESNHRRKDGTSWPVEITANYWAGEGKDILFVFITDITERLRQNKELHLLASIFENTVEAMLITDASNRIININPSFTELTGYTFEDVKGKNPKILSAGFESKEFYKQMWESIQTKGRWQGEVHDRRKDGGVYPKWLSIKTIRNSENKITHYLGSFINITEQKNAETEIRKLAFSDTLTGLHNRLSLISQFENEIHRAKVKETKLAIFFIDLDRFKVINDTLGHQIGDNLIIEVAGRIRTSIRENDLVARLGGDEFVVILESLDREDDAAKIAQKLIQEVSQPFLIDGNILYTSLSIGICVFPHDGSSVSTLMQNADTAMYQAKNEGGKCFKFFAPEMNRMAVERLNMENGLHQALEKRHFELYYQPQVNREGIPVGMEALIRWRHPELGLISPDQFIPVAEETGIITQIGSWVLKTACTQFQRWKRSGFSIRRIAVNLSVHEFLQSDFTESVMRILNDTGMSGPELELEITERSAMTDPERITMVMHSLKKLGIRISIDDFGTGYSSLAYLGRFPIDTLKLDRTFIEKMEDEESAMAITLSTIELAKKLGMEVIAEGVETRDQSEILFEAGCNLQQGYFFYKPIPSNLLLDSLISTKRS